MFTACKFPAGWVLIGVAVWGGSGWAADYTAGDMVVVQQEARLLLHEKAGEVVESGDILAVEKVKDGWLWVRKTEEPGWLVDENVEPLRVAIDRAFIAHVNEPNKERFLDVRRLILAWPQYDPYSNDLVDIESLYGEKKFDAAKQQLDKSMPNLLLSPRAHILAYLIARGRGDFKVANNERVIIKSLYQGLMSTGDGTREHPYLVLRVSDEYDLLMHFSKKASSNSTQSIEEKHFDVLHCEDGSSVWFDVTDAYRWMQEKMKKE